MHIIETAIGRVQKLWDPQLDLRRMHSQNKSWVMLVDSKVSVSFASERVLYNYVPRPSPLPKLVLHDTQAATQSDMHLPLG